MFKPTKNKCLVCFALCAATTLLACGEPSARVSLDFYGLVDNSAMTVDRLDQLRLMVSPDTTVPDLDRRQEFDIDLSGEDLDFELDIIGGDWLIEVVGEETVGSEPPNATYFGDLRISVEPQTEVDVTIPLFPAGTAWAPVWVLKDLELVGVLVTFIPREPREGESHHFGATLTPRTEDTGAPEEFDAFNLIRILPTGDYDVTIDASVDGTNYTTVPGGDVSIVGDGPSQKGVEQGDHEPLQSIIYIR